MTMSAQVFILLVVAAIATFPILTILAVHLIWRWVRAPFRRPS